ALYRDAKTVLFETNLTWLGSSKYVDSPVFSANVGNVAHLEEETGFDYSRNLSQLLLNNIRSAKISEVCIDYQVPIIRYNGTDLPGSFSQNCFFAEALDFSES